MGKAQTFPALEPTVLPKGAVLLRIVTGDSISTPQNVAGVNGITPANLIDRQFLADIGPLGVVDTNAFYWDKFLQIDETTGLWNTTLRAVSAAEVGNKFAPLHSRVGWNNGGPYALSALPHMSLMYFIEQWSQKIGYGYVDPDGQPIPTYYVHMSYTASRFAALDSGAGAAGLADGEQTGAVNNSWDKAIASSIYNDFWDYFLTPALVELRAISRRRSVGDFAYGILSPEQQAALPSVIFCDMLVHTAGGSDCTDPDDLAALSVNLRSCINNFYSDLKGKPPTILLQPFHVEETAGTPAATPAAPYALYTAANITTGITNFNAAVATGRALGMPLLPITIHDYNVEFQETLPVGVHPSANGAMEMARRIVQMLVASSATVDLRLDTEQFETPLVYNDGRHFLPTEIARIP